MEITLPNQELYAVEYPGIIDNLEKAIKGLGGEEVISKVMSASNEKRRLHLTFRPDNIFAKVACADAFKVDGLVLKVRQLRNKRTGETKLDVRVLGHVKTMYKFESLMDFQYGSFERVTTEASNDQAFRVFHDDIVVKRPHTDLMEFLTRRVPLFVPPTMFSRNDLPHPYHFAPKFKRMDTIQREEKDAKKENMRKARKSCAIMVNNIGDVIPMEPMPGALSYISADNPERQSMKDELDEIFAWRPIWSHAGMVYHLKNHAHSHVLKQVRPIVAFYFRTGPWARTWVRIGYNPMEHKEAKQYQVVDVRIGAKTSELLSNDCSSGHNMLANVKTKRMVNERIPIYNDADLAEGTSSAETKVLKECTFRFSEDILPNARQICYQLCDIDLPEVHALLESEGSDRCDPVNGWFSNDYQSDVRYHVMCSIHRRLGLAPPSRSTSKPKTATDIEISTVYSIPSSTREERPKRSVSAKATYALTAELDEDAWDPDEDLSDDRDEEYMPTSD